MIFSDISVLNEIIAAQRELQYADILKPAKTSKSSKYKADAIEINHHISNNVIYHDSKDALVDKWYSSSPPIVGNAIFTYEFEERNEVDHNRSSQDILLAEKDEEKNSSDTYINKDNNDVLSATIPDKSKKSRKIEDLFELVPVEKRTSPCPSDNDAESSSSTNIIIPAKKSALTDMMASLLLNGKSESLGTSLQIYILDSGEYISIIVQPKSRVLDIIKRTLKEHADHRMRPPLEYSTPQVYVLRMHEGDGEPDMDFAPFEYDDEVETIYQTSQSHEFCLCEAGDDDDISDDSDIIAMRGIKPSPMRSPPPPLYRADSASQSDETSTRPDPTSDTIGSYNNGVSIARTPKLAENAILISIPNTGIVGVNINERTTLREILPLIATKHKLRLYTDEYSFVMPADEFKRLNLSSATADMDTPIKLIGATEYELQRKIYADAPRINRPKTDATRAVDNRPTMDDKIIYNDLTANAYQEWTVIKKNKFGRRQDRYIGIDGDKVYNSKRGQYSSSSGGVYRAQRDISQIRKVELVREDNDHKTLRITWIDNRDQYDLEYTCETARDCNEIIAKLKYLMKRPQNSSVNSNHASAKLVG